MNGESLDIKKENIKKLKELFPELFAEGQLDWEKLKATFSNDIDFANERYYLNWAGKADAFKNLQQPTTATLKPVREESVNFDTTENIFIEGENLEVLKVLQKSYYGKIKCIIIDPPYNTGNDSFVYPDNFKESKDNYEKRIIAKDEQGNLMKETLLRKNTKDSGHFHSNWLSMMYPRLFLARNLLKDNGVIFVHIDDNEVHNLRLLMNEVFGEENFIEIFSWVKTSTPPALSKKSRKTIEYILCFEKNKSAERYFSELLAGDDQPLLNTSNNEGVLSFPKDKVFFKLKDGLYPKGQYDKVFLLTDIEIKNGTAASDFELRGHFKWQKDFLKQEIDAGTTFIIKTEKFSIRFQRPENDGFKTPTNLIKEKYITSIINRQENGVGTNEAASSALEELMGGKFFDFPKPVSLEKYIANFITGENDIILDFFAGSATTGHAILELNKEDNRQRSFILVQFPEPYEQGSEAFKAGYKTIADTGKERIRRVLNKINTKDENNKIDFAPAGGKGPISGLNQSQTGLKVFSLSTSNFKTWRGNDITPENIMQQLAVFTDPIKKDFDQESMLYELLLKSGHSLTEKITPINNYYAIADGSLIIALTAITAEIITSIIAAGPQKVITLDSLFAGNDELKTNTVLQMRAAAIDFNTL